MSKASMARLLESMGKGRFNTLRKLPVDTLQSMLDSLQPGNAGYPEPIGPAHELVTIPTDAEIMRAAGRTFAEVPAPVPVPPSRLQQWVALAMAPVGLIRSICGV
jgi:hypothetical protein